MGKPRVLAEAVAIVVGIVSESPHTHQKRQGGNIRNVYDGEAKQQTSLDMSNLLQNMDDMIKCLTELKEWKQSSMGPVDHTDNPDSGTQTKARDSNWNF